MKDRRVVIYARVSTESKEQETSLQRQIDLCKEKSKEEGWVVVGTGKEKVSGIKYHPFERDNFPIKMEVNDMDMSLRFRDKFKDKKFNTILVKNSERFSRDEEHKKHALRTLDQIGIEVMSLAEDIQTGDPMKDAITGLYTEVNKKKIKERNESIRKTLEKKKEKGEPVGKPIKGMRFNEDATKLVPLHNAKNKRYEEDPVTWDQIKEAFKMKIEEGLNPNKISKRTDLSTSTAYRIFKTQESGGNLEYYLPYLEYEKEDVLNSGGRTYV